MRALLCKLGFHSLFWQSSRGGTWQVCRYCVYASPDQHTNTKTAEDDRDRLLTLMLFGKHHLSQIEIFDALVNPSGWSTPLPGPMRHVQKEL